MVFSVSKSPETVPNSRLVTVTVLEVTPSLGEPICRRMTGSSTAASASKTLVTTTSSPGSSAMLLKLARAASAWEALSTRHSALWALAA